jgi:phospholipase C
MLENRSFDHMLGYSEIKGLDGVWDKECSNVDRNGKKWRTTPEAQPSGELPDPGHDYDDVKTQLYYRHDQGNTNTLDPTMEGFITSYTTYNSDKPQSVMNCFPPDSLPVLTTLAENFAVCNRWFSSIPGPTLPNRLFAHAGTSKGRLDLSAEEFDISPTIYEALDCANVSSTIYADGWTAAATFWNLMKYQDQYFGTLDDFYQDCYDNNLPGYSFIEPRYSSGVVNGTFRAQNDQHPDSDVTEGEHLIYSIYKAIRSNRRVWESSMFVIVYDEHGGLYDHVPPPKAVPPRPQDVSTKPPFDFDRYGVRVPAVIVSAYTERVVCNDLFDHTSLIATARKLLTGHYQDDFLGNRAMGANTFDCVLNLKEPCNDHIEFAPLRAERREHESKCLNHLQIKNLQQAFLLDCRLPSSLQVRPTSPFKDLDETKSESFCNIKTVDAEHYIQNVLTTARHLGPKLRLKQLCEP